MYVRSTTAISLFKIEGNFSDENEYIMIYKVTLIDEQIDESANKPFQKQFKNLSSGAA